MIACGIVELTSVFQLGRLKTNLYNVGACLMNSAITVEEVLRRIPIEPLIMTPKVPL